MALLTAGLTAAVIAGVAGTTASTTAVVVTNNRHIDITSRTFIPVVVTVEVEKATIQPKETRRFKVKQATPIIIKVKWPISEESDTELEQHPPATPSITRSKNLTTLELEYEDENHWDYTVADWGDGGLQIFPSNYHGWPNKEKNGKIQHQFNFVDRILTTIISTICQDQSNQNLPICRLITGTSVITITKSL